MTTSTSMFAPGAIAKVDKAWAKLLGGKIAPEQAAFPLEPRRAVLDILRKGGRAVIAGFFYRDNDGDGRFSPEDIITATLLGAPRLAGPDAPDARLYSNCFIFGPVKPGAHTMKYEVDGVEPFSQDVTTSAGLNVVHVRVTPTKPLIYICPHSHFDPEWTELYERYMAIEIPHMLERIELLHDEPAHCFSLDEEAATRPLLERRPDITDELRRRIIEGVVEPKCTVVATEFNMPLGEPMIRQMLIGEQTLSEMLGVEIRPNVLWNIDNYGISFQVAQILRKAGRRHFILGEYRQWQHQKDGSYRQDMPFSNPAVWDHPEFWLESPDGSKVLCHRSPYFATPFAPHVPVERLRPHLSSFNFQGSDFHGPNRELVDKVKALNAENGEYKFIIATSEQFFRAVEADPGLPTFRTESRMGIWTGSYETRVRGRQLNREVECLLLAAEALSTAATQVGMPDRSRELREAWYTLLINQHHDPQLCQMFQGLFPEVIARYKDAEAQALKLLNGAMNFTLFHIRTDDQPGIPVGVFNSLGWKRTGLAEVAMQSADGSRPRDEGTIPRIVDAAGRPVPVQMVDPDPDAQPVKMAFLTEEVPATGWKTYYLQKDENAPELPPLVSASESCVENEHIRVELSGGQIEKVIEKSTGACLFEANAEAGINEVFIWQDEGCICTVRPVDFRNEARLIGRSSQAARTVRVVEGGPIRAVVETGFTLDGGAFRQRVVLEAGSQRVQFKTTVDWTPHETEGRRVRVAFASANKDTRAWRDIPFGVIAWEQTDVIQPVNTWLGLSTDDGAHGAALISRGMCSAHLSRDVMWLTLFRSVRMSEEGCEWGWNVPGDQALEAGTNTYEYSLYPYAGDWQAAAVPRASLEVNTPLFARQGPRQTGKQAAQVSLLSVEPADLVPCVWKKADYSDATIVRVYNPTDAPVRGTLNVGFPVASAEETNFREERTGAVTGENGTFALEFGPYEIKTVRLVPPG